MAFVLRSLHCNYQILPEYSEVLRIMIWKWIIMLLLWFRMVKAVFLAGRHEPRDEIQTCHVIRWMVSFDGVFRQNVINVIYSQVTRHSRAGHWRGLHDMIHIMIYGSRWDTGIMNMNFAILQHRFFFIFFFSPTLHRIHHRRLQSLHSY